MGPGNQECEPLASISGIVLAIVRRRRSGDGTVPRAGNQGSGVTGEAPESDAW